jgi:hypothetical protein
MFEVVAVVKTLVVEGIIGGKGGSEFTNGKNVVEFVETLAPPRRGVAVGVASKFEFGNPATAVDCKETAPACPDDNNIISNTNPTINQTKFF